MLRGTLLFCCSLSVAAAIAVFAFRPAVSSSSAPALPAATRPDILLLLADDWSYPHAGAYGDLVVKTPTFDRLAREGALFTNAYCAAPSCTPSRAALLTGLVPHQLEEGGQLWGSLPRKFEVYPDLLEAAGYYVGQTRKGWGPGDFKAGGRERNPAGPQFASFAEFYQGAPKDRPFCFWFGSQDPHRPYDRDAGLKSGMNPNDVSVPAFLPDTPKVRRDLLDYYFEVERFDREAGEILRQLERDGRLDNTLVVITGDNGMPFPRAKANLYDGGTRVPLAVRWPGHVRSGATVNEFVALTDLAPTFLEAAGVRAPSAMTARSLLPLLAGRRQADREQVFLERERHANVRRGNLSYPARAVRTAEFLYVRNLRPDRLPAGDPEYYFAVGPFGDIDGSPSKELLLARRNDRLISRYFHLATDKRPAEELYDLKKDPAQLENVAARSEYAADRRRLRAQLEKWMHETEDPRARIDDDRYDAYPYYGPRGRDASIYK